MSVPIGVADSGKGWSRIRMGAEGLARADFDSKVKVISVGRLWLTLFYARYFDRPLPSYGNIAGINELAPPD